MFSHCFSTFWKFLFFIFHFSKPNSRPIPKLGEEWPLPRRNWDQISSRSV